MISSIDITTISAALTSLTAVIAFTGLLVYRVRLRDAKSKKLWELALVVINLGITARFLAFYILNLIGYVESQASVVWLRPVLPLLFLTLAGTTIMLFVRVEEDQYNSLTDMIESQQELIHEQSMLIRRLQRLLKD